jgi:demethylmenaquinone methyltransferase/2-methoxy-6-polyprenyl-1,4-benzoquinol methylase
MAVVPYKESTDAKKIQVAEMFNNISARYDFLNHALSLGVDIWWRKKAVNLLAGLKPKKILDIATGTADLAIEASRLKPDSIIGIDISEGMLSYGRTKLKDLGLDKMITLEGGDSENLRFANDSFDAVMVAFGVRNFENLSAGLLEMNRVLKPGGKVVILEFSKPKAFPIKQLYSFYNKAILPVVGKSISKDTAAYTYLPESVAAFPEGMDFVNILSKAHFKDTKAQTLTFGIVTLYSGIK